MRKLLAVCAVTGLILSIAGTTSAASVQTDLEYTVTLSGSWSANWNYSGSNNWVDTYVGGVRQTVGPLSGSAATSNGHATAAGQINGLVISQTDHAHVWGIASDSDWGWALGYSDAGSNWLTAESNNPATVTFSYAYTLDASQASVDWESRVNMYVQVWGGAGNAERLVAPPWTRRASSWRS